MDSCTGTYAKVYALMTVTALILSGENVCPSCTQSEPTKHSMRRWLSSLLRVFWSEALTPALARVYHRNRTLSLLGLPGSNVGLDMLIEKENLTIRNNVIRASIERITRFVRRLNFTAHVSRHLERVLFPHRNRMTYKKVDISRDVALVKQHLIATLGGTWAAANAPCTTLLSNPARAPAPWKAVERLGQVDPVVW